MLRSRHSATNWSARAFDECRCESVRALSGSYPGSVIQLVRPSEKGVDNSERVNESVSENAGLKVTTGKHVSDSQDQSCHARIDHTRYVFVIMPVEKHDRNEHDPDPKISADTTTEYDSFIVDEMRS